MSEAERLGKVEAAARVAIREAETARRVAGDALGKASEIEAGLTRLATTVERVATTLRVPAPAGEGDVEDIGEFSWLVDPEADPDAALHLLGKLIEWLACVYIRYPGGDELPACWLWHPWVVEELFALRSAWQSAYVGESASAVKVSEWHDRWRVGAVERINALRCNLRSHAHPEAGGTLYLTPRVPGVGDKAALAAWWAQTAGGQAPPPPSAETLASADAEAAARRDLS